MSQFGAGVVSAPGAVQLENVAVVLEVEVVVAAHGCLGY
jgi:hypothetical protein